MASRRSISYYLGLTMLLILHFNAGAADQEFYDPVLTDQCAITPAIWSVDRIPALYTANNLRLKTGSSQFASGVYVEIAGRVLDERCVPVSQALVQIWHADSNGYYKSGTARPTYLNEQLLYRQPLDQFYSHSTNDSDRSDPYFTGSGSAVTDNLGYYRFFTIMPGKSAGELIPYVSFVVSHKDFETLRTRMFFPENAAEVPAALKNYRLNELDQQRLIAGTIEGVTPVDDLTIQLYNFNIVLPGRNKYLQY